jgi:class 3 adenylate cyclase/tetratricopeptide (TPR) repeat protein
VDKKSQRQSQRKRSASNDLLAVFTTLAHFAGNSERDAMRCTKCNLGNRAGRKFCSSCGTVLPVPCDDCGFPNEVGEKYCGGCGRALVSDETAAPDPRRTADSEGDRRPVTVLFCDLVGYTKLSSVLDPEDVHALLERFFALVDTTVDRFGGTIDKHIGDSVMALFGAPLARGNDAERAVRAALEIQASIPDLASDLSLALAVHIGIATGEVIASSVGSRHHRGYTVTGEAANVAARLLEKAASGETLVSDAVYRATGHLISYDPLGSLVLRGVGHPVEVWRVSGTKSSTQKAHALVGRRAELGEIRAILDACVNGTKGTPVLIRGEAGIGKTRLIDEVRSIAVASGMSSTAGFVLDFGTARGHGAVRTVISGLLGLGSATPDDAGRAIDVAIRDGQLQADDAPYLRDLLEMPQPKAAQKLYEAMDAGARTYGKERVVGALVRASANNRPLLVTIEDIHWADQEALSLLAAVTRATGVSQTVLIMTTRLEGDPLDAHWRSTAGGAAVVTIDLSPLSPIDARSIARRFINVSSFADQCVERAGGNPLFLEQLLLGARDLADGRLPASIQSVILARTDLLSGQDRRAIQAASVLGQRLSLPQLRELLHEPGIDCDTLVRNDLLRPMQDGLQFAHALVRDGVYGSLTNARKRELHRAAAAIFFDDSVLRAEHLDRAGDPEAPRAYLTAARKQGILFRQDQGIALAARGLALAVEERDTIQLAMLLGDLQRDAGRGTEALEAYVRALTVASDDVSRYRALLGCAASNRLTAKLDDAFSGLAQAEPLARKSGDDRALAEIHYTRGNLHFARGELVECRSEHELALQAARRGGSPDWQARALSGLADAQYMDCRMASALTHFSSCVDLCEAHDLTRIAVPNRVMMGCCRIYTCEFDRGLDDIRLALQAAVKIGDRHAEMFATQAMGFCLTGAGRYAEADEFVIKGLEQARILKARRYEAGILGQVAEVALSKGQRADALALARTGREISEEVGPGFVGPMLFGLLALLEYSRNDQEAALAAGEALLAQGCVGHNHFWFRRYAIERALLLEDWNEVHHQADALILRMANEPFAYASFVAERAESLAQIGRGQAIDPASEKLKALSMVATSTDMRVDALGVALRKIQ